MILSIRCSQSGVSNYAAQPLANRYDGLQLRGDAPVWVIEAILKVSFFSALL